MPNVHKKKKCHICGKAQRVRDLLKRHYPSQHPEVLNPVPLEEGILFL